MLDSYGDILTIENVCDVLMIGRNQAYKLLKNGELKGFKIGKRAWKIPKNSLKEFIDSCGYSS